MKAWIVGIRTVAIGGALALALTWNQSNDQFLLVLPLTCASVLAWTMILKAMAVSKAMRERSAELNRRIAMFSKCPVSRRRALMEAHFEASMMTAMTKRRDCIRLHDGGLVIMVPGEVPVDGSQPVNDDDIKEWASKLAEQHVKTLAIMDETLESALPLFIEADVTFLKKLCES